MFDVDPVSTPARQLLVLGKDRGDYRINLVADLRLINDLGKAAGAIDKDVFRSEES